MCVVSIIIPAFNEQRYIADTLAAIASHPPHPDYEVIVVDNGSTDETANLAKVAGASLIDFPVGTVAAVRNRGVQEAKGDILVFIDADVVVSPEWSQEMAKVIPLLQQQPMQITGSRCLPVDNTHWLNRYWFGYLNQYEASYINSGHLIASKELFDAIDGFNGDLETAEDYDFCQRATVQGAKLINNKTLLVTHHGYPQSIARYIRRERWHGSEDVQSPQAFLHSKMAVAASLQLAMLLGLFVFLLLGGGFNVIAGYVVLTYLSCLALTLLKFRLQEPKAWIITPFICYLYLTGRWLSIVDRVAALITVPSSKAA